MQIDVLGRKRLVQPKCECEWEHEKKKLDEAARHHQIRETERLFTISNLGKRFAESTFETYNVRPGSEKSFEIAKRYVSEFETWGPQSLLIWGIPGNGKTHLAASIATALHVKGKIVVFQSVPELLERIKSTFNKNSRDTEEQIMKALLSCDLLIFDDIGAEKLTDWVQDVMFRIIDGRYRKEMPILYTSNLRPNELADQVSDRTYDRITETTLQVENKASSYRREIAKERIRKLSEGC
jgi:DNA replication protein DnaC